MAKLKMSTRLAEFVGIMLGDGSIVANSRIKQYAVYVCGNSEDDERYLLNFIKPLIKDLFAIEMSVKYHQKFKEILLYKYSKDFVKILEGVGLKAGNKKDNNVGFPNWIFTDKKFIAACLRGLFNTDGTIYKRWKHKGYFIEFTSNIFKLQTDIIKALDLLEINHSIWFRSKGPIANRCSICSQAAVKRFLSTVGSSNPKYNKIVLKARVV